MENQTTARSTNSNLGTIAWLMFFASIALIIHSLANAVIYIPMLIAVFIMSIVMITQKNVASGVVLLIFTLILPGLTWTAKLSYNVADAFQEVENSKREDHVSMKAHLKFEDIRVYTIGDYMYCEGKVRNTGYKPYEYVKVKVEWLDKQKRIIDTDYTYLVTSEGLEVNEAKSFNIMTPLDVDMESARYYIME